MGWISYVQCETCEKTVAKEAAVTEDWFTIHMNVTPISERIATGHQFLPTFCSPDCGQHWLTESALPLFLDGEKRK